MPRHPASPRAPRPRKTSGPTTQAPDRRLQVLLQQVAEGSVSPDAALATLRALPFEDLGYANVDHHRALRKGFPEVIYCAGKTPQQVAGIFTTLAASAPRVLGTRATPEHAAAARRAVRGTQYDTCSRTIWVDREPDAPRLPGIVLAAAGTSDLPVAEEAARTLDLLGHSAERVFDVGVAGLHRLLRHTRVIQDAHVVIVVAGMEGALASVVGGLTAAPIIAVPTSVGYGASLGGLTALFAMLNSCASGVSVVNIDNGFGAACVAASINRQIHRPAAD